MTIACYFDPLATNTECDACGAQTEDGERLCALCQHVTVDIDPVTLALATYPEDAEQTL